MTLRAILLALLLGLSPWTLADCNLDPDAYGEPLDGDATSEQTEAPGFWGGCDSFQPTFRAGVSDRYGPFVTAGVLLPIDETLSFEYASADGVVVAGSLYDGAEIYDFGYMKRHLWWIPMALEGGVSFMDDDRNWRGLYLEFAMGLMLQYRWLTADGEHKSSFEIGVRY